MELYLLCSLQFDPLEIHDFNLDLYKLKVAMNNISRTVLCFLAYFIVSFSLACLMYAA
jgi:ABC-type transport system involved in Fe-S cluster assembly fused permease/ATPase subunit